MLQVSKVKGIGKEEIVGVEVVSKMNAPIRVKTKVSNNTNRLTPLPSSFILGLDSGKVVSTSEINRLSELYKTGVLFLSEYKKSDFICKELGSMPLTGLVNIAQKKLGSLGRGSFVSLVISSCRDNPNIIRVSTVDVTDELFYAYLISAVNGRCLKNTVEITHPEGYMGIPEDEAQPFYMRWAVVKLVEFLNNHGYEPDSVCLDYVNGSFRGISFYTWD